MGGLLGHDGTPPSELYELARRQLSAYPAIETKDGLAVAAGVRAQGFPAKPIRVIVGYTAGGACQDVKLGLDHHGNWKRCALLTDAEWVIHVAQLLGRVGRVCQLPLAARGEPHEVKRQIEQLQRE